MAAKIRILYVDDEKDIRTIVDLAMRLDPDIEIVTADSGDAALEMIGEGKFMPDLALLDMMMPDMSGIDLLVAMLDREDIAHVPVLFVTASARSMEVQNYTDAGAIGVISKPFDAIKLAATVREHFEAFQRAASRGK